MATIIAYRHNIMKYPIDLNNPDTYVICEICKNKYKRISHKHLYKHNLKLADYINRFPNIKTVCKQLTDVFSITLENLIKMYGNDDGTKKWDEYVKKQAYSNTFEFKKIKYGWDEKQFHEYNKNRSCTLENFIKRHGRENGLLKWENYKNIQKYAGSTVEYFIEKYGETEGRIKWNAICKNKSNSIENFILRYGEIRGKLKYNQHWANRFNHLYSKISQKLFDEIYDKSDGVFYATHNKEFFIYDKNEKCIRFYDYVDTKRKKCIEFNGDLFHANPQIFKENDNPNPFNLNLKSSDIWEMDKIKNNLIKNNGYQLLIVWERDYIHNSYDTVLKCKKFLYNE